MSLLSRFMRFFFHHFYHSFAWTYDFVASVVSIGRWNDWTQTVIPSIAGKNILEIGHGPGHLQKILREKNLSVIGLDESVQMIRLAKHRLEATSPKKINLTRGLAQSLPFPDLKFDTVISTFPSEYIFNPYTAPEVYRVLRDGGQFIVLPAAWIIGRKLQDRIAAWVFRVTGETPKNVIEIVEERFVRPLADAGFQVESKPIEIRSSIVLVLLARKTSAP